jgi:hypothetical protein
MAQARGGSSYEACSGNWGRDIDVAPALSLTDGSHKRQYCAGRGVVEYARPSSPFSTKVRHVSVALGSGPSSAASGVLQRRSRPLLSGWLHRELAYSLPCPRTPDAVQIGRSVTNTSRQECGDWRCMTLSPPSCPPPSKSGRHCSSPKEPQPVTKSVEIRSRSGKRGAYPAFGSMVREPGPLRRLNRRRW